MIRAPGGYINMMLFLRIMPKLLNFLWFNTPQLVAEHWGCGGFVPPHTQRFQGEIFNTPEFAPGILYSWDQLYVKGPLRSFFHIFLGFQICVRYIA
jgi:hypothetical protein